MSDHTLRALERRWRETRVEADEVAYLLARLRAGDLPRRRLELAAYLGHPAAQRAAELEDSPPAELRPWVVGLRAWGKEACVRVALAAARCVLPIYAREHPDDRLPHTLCEAADAWLAAPNAAAEARVRELLATEPSFPRARYARATVYALEAIPSPEEAVVASELSWEVATALVDDLVDAGATVRLDPGSRDPAAEQALILVEPPERVIPAIKALREHTGARLNEVQIALYPELAADRAELAVRCAVDSVWAEDGLTEDAIRAAILQEVVPWALGSARVQ